MARIKRWWSARRNCNQKSKGEEMGSEASLKNAMRQYEKSARLVAIHSMLNARALRQLNRFLALRVKGLESISAAEDALASLDRDKHDDK